MGLVSERSFEVEINPARFARCDSCRSACILETSGRMSLWHRAVVHGVSNPLCALSRFLIGILLGAFDSKIKGVMLRPEGYLALV